MRKNKTQELLYCTIFVALLSVSAYISIPLPPVPFTLQLQVAMLAGFFLGGKWGLIAVCMYITLGLVGLPVFFGGAGGLTAVLNPTFGYVIGFAAASLISGIILRRSSLRRSSTLQNPPFFAACAINILIVYAFGMTYYYIILHFYMGKPADLWFLISSSCLLTLPKDIFLCVPVIAVYKKVAAATSRSYFYSAMCCQRLLFQYIQLDVKFEVIYCVFPANIFNHLA